MEGKLRAHLVLLKMLEEQAEECFRSMGIGSDPPAPG